MINLKYSHENLYNIVPVIPNIYDFKGLSCDVVILGYQVEHEMKLFLHDIYIWHALYPAIGILERTLFYFYYIPFVPVVSLCI